MRYLLVLAAAIALGACGSDTDIPAQCNPLGGQGCMLPWPSMAYAKTDATSATGYRVAIPIEAMPKNIDDTAIDPKHMNRWDGFSPSAPILVAFPNGVSGANLPGPKTPDASLAADSPIVLLDMDSGTRAPFFAEIDANVAEPALRDLIIRPLARLKPSGHYAVALRKSLKSADGSELPIPPGFAAALSGADFDHPRFTASRFPAVFAALATAGIPKTDLVLAWDFVTASDDFLHSDLLRMRELALPAIGSTGANLTFTATAQPATPGIYKSYLGTFKSPDFLTAGETDESVMRRDATGLPQMQGMRDAQFAALIPDCVATQPLPRPAIVFGHGLFGSAKEYLADDFTKDLANQHCFIIIAGDFIGFTSRQLQLAPLTVNDGNRAPQITEKLAQSVIDFISLENLTRGAMATAPEFKYNGVSVIDPANTFYAGGSLGGIMGNVFMAYDPNLTRGVLAVPGGAWSLLIERSFAWHALQGAAIGAYPDLSVYQLNIALFGMSFEPYDPITTAAHVIHDPLPGTPAKTILMWYAIGDSLVSNLSTEMTAREMGIDLLGPAVHTGWRMSPHAGPMQSGITVLDDHPTPLPPETNIPPATDNGTHSGINRKAAALRQIEAFLIAPQQVVQTCHDGVGQPAACDCATGACN